MKSEHHRLEAVRHAASRFAELRGAQILWVEKSIMPDGIQFEECFVITAPRITPFGANFHHCNDNGSCTAAH